MVRQTRSQARRAGNTPEPMELTQLPLPATPTPAPTTAQKHPRTARKGRSKPEPRSSEPLEPTLPTSKPAPKPAPTPRSTLGKRAAPSPMPAKDAEPEQDQEEEVGVFFKKVRRTRPMFTFNPPENPAQEDPQALYDRIYAQGMGAREKLRTPEEPAPVEMTEENKENENHEQINESEQPAVGPVCEPGTQMQVGTPKRAGWGFNPIKSLLNLFTPSRKEPSLAVQPPATAPPKIVLAPEQEQEIHDALTPAPQPRRTNPQTARPKTRTQSTTATASSSRLKKKSKRTPDSHIVSRVLESINPRDHDRARAWVEQAAQQFAEQDTGRLGEKRKRFETGIKIADIDSFPAHYPWEDAGSFGFLDDFDDSDDEAEAPAWYVLDQLANGRPVKRRKSAHNNIMEEDIPSLNDLDHTKTEFAGQRLKPLFNSHGNSASLNDLHPRPSIMPSPMFDFPDHHQPNGNVFQESAPNFEANKAASRAADVDYFTKSFVRTVTDENGNKKTTILTGRESEKERELRREGHIEGSGTFCVPEGSSSSEDEDDIESEKPEDPAWLKKPSQTQSLQPPPAPVPAHATLPSPIKASPVVPPIQREEPEDPVKIQRALAMKHTPAKPSRLREAMIPSPSMISDASNDSILSFHYDEEPIIVNDADGIPEIYRTPLNADLEKYVEQLLASPSYQTQNATAWGGSDVTWGYVDDDDELL